MAQSTTNDNGYDDCCKQILVTNLSTILYVVQSFWEIKNRYFFEKKTVFFKVIEILTYL